VNEGTDGQLDVQVAGWALALLAAARLRAAGSGGVPEGGPDRPAVTVDFGAAELTVSVAAGVDPVRWSPSGFVG
jgi:hypothetical protein